MALKNIALALLLLATASFDTVNAHSDNKKRMEMHRIVRRGDAGSVFIDHASPSEQAGAKATKAAAADENKGDTKTTAAPKEKATPLPGIQLNSDVSFGEFFTEGQFGSFFSSDNSKSTANNKQEDTKNQVTKTVSVVKTVIQKETVTVDAAGSKETTSESSKSSKAEDSKATSVSSLAEGNASGGVGITVVESGVASSTAESKENEVGAKAPETASSVTATVTGVGMTAIGAIVSDGATDTAAAATLAAQSAAASAAPFVLPGRSLSVLPIGLGVFAGVSVLALIIVGVVTYERKKYRRQFRKRKMQEQVSQAGGYGTTAGMSQVRV